MERICLVKAETAIFNFLVQFQTPPPFQRFMRSNAACKSRVAYGLKRNCNPTQAV